MLSGCPCDANAALSDRTLCSQATNYLGDGHFLPIGSPGIPAAHVLDATCFRIIEKIQKRYTRSERKLRLALHSSADIANALAVWTRPDNDWIVLSIGLLQKLHGGASRLGDLICTAYPTYGLATTLNERSGSGDGELSQLAEAIYAAVVAFFLGHEAGHHFEGHDGFYGPMSAVSESDILNLSNATIDSHALELGADLFGANESIRIMVAYLVHILPEGAINERSKSKYAEQIIFLAAAGVFAALFVLKPRKNGNHLGVGSTHPAKSFRALWLTNVVTSELANNFSSLDGSAIMDLVIQALIAAVGLTVNACEFGEWESYQKREGDIAALRATGIRRLIFDDGVSDYVATLHSRYLGLRERLGPYARGPDAMPIQTD